MRSLQAWSLFLADRVGALEAENAELRRRLGDELGEFLDPAVEGADRGEGRA
jgi:hypothetical protein